MRGLQVARAPLLSFTRAVRSLFRCIFFSMDVLESKQWHERLASELKIYQRNELRNSEIALKAPPRVCRCTH